MQLRRWEGQPKANLTNTVFYFILTAKYSLLGHLKHYLTDPHCTSTAQAPQ